jgi:hypothetical protein
VIDKALLRQITLNSSQGRFDSAEPLFDSTDSLFYRIESIIGFSSKLNVICPLSERKYSDSDHRRNWHPVSNLLPNATSLKSVIDLFPNPRSVLLVQSHIVSAGSIVAISKESTLAATLSPL